MRDFLEMEKYFPMNITWMNPIFQNNNLWIQPLIVFDIDDGRRN